jgi:hypothetical protein
MDVKEKVGNLIAKLTSYHWSPQHPTTYTIDIEGSLRGVGKIADRNYGAFNLAWGTCQGKWQTKDEQHELVINFAKFQVLTLLPVNGEPVGDWACLLGPRGFKALISAADTLDPKDKHSLISAATGAMHVQHI